MTDILALDIATTTHADGVLYLYALYAGQQLLPCYIGIGRGDRMHQHLRYARAGNSSRGNVRKYRTLRACLRRGIPVVGRKLATGLTIDQACSLERFFISSYGRRDLKTGCLLNASAGGAGCRVFAPSTKRKLAEAGRRHMARPEIRRMLDERRRAPEAIAKLSAAQRGKRPSIEARAKMSASCRARNQRDPDNWRSFLACRTPGGFQGRSHSIEVKARIADAAREQWTDPDIRKKRSAFFRALPPEAKVKIDAARFGRRTMLGKKHSSQTRAKMSAAQKQRRAREAADAHNGA